MTKDKKQIKMAKAFTITLTETYLKMVGILNGRRDGKKQIKKLSANIDHKEEIL